MLWVVGVVLSLAASVVNNLGLALQANVAEPRNRPPVHAPQVTVVFGAEYTGSVFTLEEDDDNEEKRDPQPASQTPTQLFPVALGWDDTQNAAEGRQALVAAGASTTRKRLGLACMVVGAGLDVASYGFAPLSLLAPLGSVSLLANLVVAKRVLGETRARADWLACAVIATGTMLAVVFSAKSAPRHPLGAVLGNLGSAAFMVFAAVLATGYRIATWAATRPGAGAVAVTVAWCCASSLACSAGVAASKVLAEASGTRPGDLVCPQAGVIALGAGTAMLTQLRTMNRAVAAGGTLLAVPLSQVVTLVLNLVTGAVVFNDYSRVRHPAGTVFGVGVCIALVGTSILLTHRLRLPPA